MNTIIRFMRTRKVIVTITLLTIAIIFYVATQLSGNFIQSSIVSNNGSMTGSGITILTPSSGMTLPELGNIQIKTDTTSNIEKVTVQIKEWSPTNSSFVNTGALLIATQSSGIWIATGSVLPTNTYQLVATAISNGVNLQNSSTDIATIKIVSIDRTIDAIPPILTISSPSQNDAPLEIELKTISGSVTDAPYGDVSKVECIIRDKTNNKIYIPTTKTFTNNSSISDMPWMRIETSQQVIGQQFSLDVSNKVLFPFENNTTYEISLRATDTTNNVSTKIVSFTYKSNSVSNISTTLSPQITSALRTINTDIVLTGEATLPAGANLPAGTILPNTTTAITAPMTTTAAIKFGTGATLKAGTIFPIGSIIPANITLGTVGSSAGTGSTTPTSTSTAATLPSTSTGMTSTGSTATSTGQTMTGTLLQTAVVKDNGTSISFPIAFKTVSFAKDTTSASIVATIEPTQKLPAGVPLKICYQKTASLAQGVCITATQNANDTYTAKLPLRSDEAGTYNWVLAMGDVALTTYGTLEVKVTNGVSSLTNTMLKNDPVATVTVPKNQLLTATLAPVNTAKPATVQVSLSVEKVTWSTINKMMAAEVTMKDGLHEKLPVGVCYIEKTATAKPACTSLGKSGALTYTGTTLIAADKPATYAWVITVADTPLNVEGTLTVSQKNGIFEAVATTDKNTPTTLAIETALLGTLKPVVQTMTGTSAGSTLTCPPTCIGQSSLVPDVPVDHFAFTPISKLLSRGIMSGYADGTFRPALAINRAEFTKLTKNTFLIPTLDKSAALSFSDITANAWFYTYVRSLSQVGLIKGYSDGTFRAGNNILRSEAAKIIALAHRMQTVLNANPNLTFTDALEKADMDITASFLAFTNENPTYTYALLQDVPVNSWYAKYVYYAVRNDLIKGRDTAGGRVFAPGAQILRGEAATLLSRVIETLDIKYPMNKDAAGVVTAAFPE